MEQRLAKIERRLVRTGRWYRLTGALAVAGVVTTLALLPAGPALTQDATRSEHQDNVEAAVIARQRAWYDALSRGNPEDADFLAHFEMDGATRFEGPSPSLLTNRVDSATWRSTFESMRKQQPPAEHSYIMTRTHVQVYGDTAILTYRLSDVDERNSKAKIQKVTDVYVRQNGTWLQVHEHASDLLSDEGKEAEKLGLFSQ